MRVAKPRKTGDETPTQAKALGQRLAWAWQHKRGEFMADAKADPAALPAKASPTESQRKKRNAERVATLAASGEKGRARAAM
eukprot:1972992-Alexandrium_andersonii.AAC.1